MIGSPDEDRSTPALWGTAAILTAGGFLSMFTSTVVTVALGTIAAGFRAPLGTAQWIVTGYRLALAAMVPVSGWASRSADRVPCPARRRGKSPSVTTRWIGVAWCSP